jgi:predicted Zn-dependent peptidase
MELRERRGLAYDIGSGSSHYRDCGAITVYCGTDPTKVDETLRGIMHELELMHERVAPEELDRAAAFATGRLQLRLEDTRAVMSWLGAQELLFDHVRLPEEVIASVRAVTVDEVQAAADTYITPDNYRLAVVGPYRSDARFRKLLV